MVGDVGMMADKRSKLELPVGMGVRGRGDLPHLYLPTESYGEMASRRGKSKGSGGGSERKVVYGYATGNISEDGVSILVDGEQKVAPRG